MSFQIKNEEGQPLLMSQLDSEAAEFWGKPVHEKQYAYPEKDPDTSGMDAKEASLARLIGRQTN